MDLDEWELLPDDGFLEIHDDGGKMIFSRKYGSDQKSVFRMNYFSPNSPKLGEKPEKSRVPNQLVPVPIFQLEPPMMNKAKDDEVRKDTNKVPIEIKLVPSMPSEQITAANTAAVEADQDMVSQVFFKKENEFVDMKMDSPRSGTRGIVPQIDVGAFQFEDKDQEKESKSFPSNLKAEKENLESHGEEEVNWEENSGGLNLWKWSLSGVGAICSFGVAAATICIIVFGGSQRNKQHQKNQKLRFQIYTDDKKIKHPSKLNDAISVARGVPLPIAQITCGGYYDGL
ncbi:uncharacterized protein LOC132293743 [Cornus florida]|uniref:uncharacterized protein LOC132293743 n=1 Tax=Cornus florida TaxID=4283 RepID=UPI002899256C|nr:uncharacterized protein LOC132293743 [Cornus florida]